MELNLPEWLGVLGLIMSVAVAAGAGLALVRGSYTKVRMEALREDNSDLRNRVKDCEDKVSASEAREQLLDQQVKHMQRENDLLKEMVTQRANVEGIGNMLQYHHDQAMSRMDSLGDLMLEILLEPLAEAVAERILEEIRDDSS